MKIYTLFPLMALLIGASISNAQTDMFWSLNDLNTGAINAPLEPQLTVGEKRSMYLYFDPMATDLDTGCFLDFTTSTDGIIKFTGGASLCFDLAVGSPDGPIVGVRWGDIFGEGMVSEDGQLFQVNASAIVTGTGMVSQNTGPVFFDQGYDIQAGAFQFARVDFEVIGSGKVDIMTAAGAGGIVSNGMTVSPSFGQASFDVTDEIVRGDLNGDGLVTLLDVQPFVAALVSGEFVEAADMNQDGAVNLEDVQPFIEAFDFP